MVTTAGDDQADLAALLAERAAWISADGADGATAPADMTVVVALRAFDPVDVADGARRFAAGLDAPAALRWRRSWTRTRFVFGDPANLRPDDVRVTGPAATAAWLGPFPDDRWPGQARLLKPVSGRLPDLPEHAEVPGRGPARDLWTAVAGLSLVDYLVHLHHTVAEAVLLGRLDPGERLRLRHRAALSPAEQHGPPAYARVLPEPDAPGRLRLHTWLTGTPV